MIKSIIVTNHLGESLELELANPYKTGFAIKSIDGIGPVKANVNTTSITSGDGSSFNSARFEERNITMKLSFMFATSVEEARHKSYQYFPVKKWITLEFVTDTRRLKATGVVESNNPNIFDKDEGCSISVICPDPNFYSSGSENKNITNFTELDTLFEFPIEDGGLEITGALEFGSIKSLKQNYISYKGDVDIGLTIIIHAIGDVSNPVINDNTTQETIKIDTSKLKTITGSEIIAGDTITISTVRGSKSVTLLREGKETNILNCIDKNTSWFQLSNGDNIFSYSASSGIENIRLTIENSIVYGGV
jgi:hypothetical protein